MMYLLLSENDEPFFRNSPRERMHFSVSVSRNKTIPVEIINDVKMGIQSKFHSHHEIFKGIPNDLKRKLPQNGRI